MPIYEYKCAGCGHEYEQIRRMSEADHGLECPHCRSEEVKRQLSSFATSSSSNGADLPMSGGCGKPQCGITCGGGRFN